MRPRTLTAVVVACMLAAESGLHAAEPLNSAVEATVQPAPTVRIRGIDWIRSNEDAFERAKKEGKPVFLLRMLGEIDGVG